MRNRPLFVSCCLILMAITGPLFLYSEQRTHSEIIQSQRHQFRIQLGGTADGFNTRDPVFSGVPEQSFEPMQAVRMTNTGDIDVVNPRLIVNGKRNWHTIQDLIDEALREQGDPERLSEGEKARALYEFVRQNRFHATTGDLEVRDPVKLFNIYGFGLCGDTAAVLMDLWRLAGLRVRRGFPSGHCTSEVWYDGTWHLLDADMSAVYLDRDNLTITNGARLAQDHDLVKRASRDETDAALFANDGDYQGEFISHVGHSMKFSLRPGEALEWRWDHCGKHHQAASPFFALTDTHLGENWGENAWKQLVNGRWIYSPPLRSPTGQKAVTTRNVRWSAEGAMPAQSNQIASLIWEMKMPYVIVGGMVKADLLAHPGSEWHFLISFDGEDWKPIVSSATAASQEVQANLNEFFPNRGPARFAYFLRLDLLASKRTAAIALRSISLENDLQMARLSLPALRLGNNDILYQDETSATHTVRVTWDWAEQSNALPPSAPPSPVFPADGAEIEGTQPTFHWQAAPTREGDQVAAYHFQLSAEPDCHWPLSSQFDVLLSKASSADFSRLPLTRPGLLNPGQPYYWRVRAKSNKGAWGPWSKIWRFTAQGPGVPLNLMLARNGPDDYLLSWKANPRRRPPEQYLVYASDEKGFTDSDVSYKVNVGNQSHRGLYPGKEAAVFTANYMVSTKEPRLILQPVHAYYRVLAIDVKGNRSGISDYASGPRPFVYSRPPQEARIGAEYRYEVKSILSIGDLRYRDFPPLEFYQAAFWDADQPKFTLVDEISRCGNPDPSWLGLDPLTGILRGVPGPADSGEYQINIQVEIKGAGTYIQSFPLKVVK